MIDTHAHLDFPEFDQDREEVIARFFEAGPAVAKAMAGKGKAIINVGVDLEHSRKSVEITEEHEGVFAAVGFHPEYFSKAKLSDTPELSFRIDELRKLAENKKVVAIGETGLDYFSHAGDMITDKQKENQKKGFLEQIKLAQEFDLPVAIHCRDAWHDLYEIIIKNSKIKIQNDNVKCKNKITKFVLHCYSGSSKDTEKFLELPNVYFSFSGNITYPKPAGRAEKLAEAVRMIPLDKIMLDSDAPFLAPQSRRGKRNEPIFVRYIAKKIAELKSISEGEVEEITDQNAKIFFSLP